MSKHDTSRLTSGIRALLDSTPFDTSARQIHLSPLNSRSVMMLKHLSTCSCHSNCARWSCCWTLLDGEHLVCGLVAIRWILGLKLMRMVVLWVSLIIWFIGLWPMQLWRMILETNYSVWITFVLTVDKFIFLHYSYITVSEPSRLLSVIPPSLPDPTCPFLSRSPTIHPSLPGPS